MTFPEQQTKDSLKSYLVENHADEMNQIAQEAFESRTRVLLSLDGSSYNFLTYVVGIETKDGKSPYKISLFNSIPPSLITEINESTAAHLTFPSIVVEGGKLSGDGKNLIFYPKSFMRHSETRGEDRDVFGENEKAFIEFKNPYDKKTIYRKPIFDISKSGLSFETYFDSLLFNPGESMGGLVISTESTTTEDVSATVIYKKKLFDTEHRQRYHIGLKLNPGKELKNG